MVRVLGVSPSGFHAWRDRAPSRRQRCDEVLKACIGRIHQRSRGTYGAPRIHAELAEDGVRVARKRVARLMRHMGLAGVSRRKGTRTTRRTPHRASRPGPRRTAIPSRRPRPAVGRRHHLRAEPCAGFVFLAVVVDAFSRRIAPATGSFLIEQAAIPASARKRSYRGGIVVRLRPSGRRVEGISGAFSRLAGIAVEQD